VAGDLVCRRDWLQPRAACGRHAETAKREGGDTNMPTKHRQLPTYRARHSWHRHCNDLAQTPRATCQGQWRADVVAHMLKRHNVPLERANPERLAAPSVNAD
jgi:hypothetical protein